MAGKKQGKWTIHVDEIRGNAGYETEGLFKDGNKVGIWRKYNLMGDLIAVENYKWGMYDGVQQYFSIAGLVREESWKAIDPEKKFDTIEVPDPLDPYKVEMRVIKVDGQALEHGPWRYYEAGSGALLKEENYFLGKPFVKSQPVEKEKKVLATDNEEPNKQDKPKPKAVEDWEKKNKGKKKITVRDGRSG